jgi:hypothetical protein
MMSMKGQSRSAAPPGEADPDFSPIENEPPLRWFRWLRLAPPDGLGAGRRALFFALLTWLPIVVWAAATGHLWSDAGGERLLQHYGVHVRCLLAIPLLILAEAAMHNAAKRMASQFVSSGAVGPGERAGFDRIIADVRRLRDASLVWVLLLGAAFAWSVADQPAQHDDAIAWAVGGDGAVGFGGGWFAYVVRPIFLALVMGWLWRMLLVAYWFWRVGRLDLSLVPTHPDRTGGLAFVEKLPGAFAMVAFALSAVIVSRWAHEIVYHDMTLQSFKLTAAAFVILWSLFVLLPLFALAPALMAARGRAIPAYSVLVGEQGRLVYRRWILREPVDDNPIFDAPEIGPVADAAVMYDAVKRMRVVPIGKGALVKILVPIVLPMIVVAALQIPLKELLLTVVKALV